MAHDLGDKDAEAILKTPGLKFSLDRGLRVADHVVNLW